MPAQSDLEPQTLQAVLQFAVGAARCFPVKQTILFGSRARGDAHPESDADVAVLLTGEPAPFVATKLALDDVAYDVLLDTGIRIQPLPVWQSEWNNPGTYSNPQLLANIAREGIWL